MTNSKVYTHIYNSGVENRNLFNNDLDYKVFLDYLKDYLTTPPDPEKTKKVFSVNGRVFKGVPHQPKNYFNKVELIAYSLMADHFHLLVNQITDGSLEKLIRSLCTRYVIYYNKKYRRRGPLFSGPYKSVWIKEPSQLLYLTRYLHRESFTEKGYSSYPEFINARETLWVNPKVILAFFNNSENAYFKGIKNYKNFAENYVLQENEKKIFKDVVIEKKLPGHEVLQPNTREQNPPENTSSQPPPGPLSSIPAKEDKIYAKSDKTDYLERRVLNAKSGESFKAPQIKYVSKPRKKIPEFIATTTIMYMLLVGLGVRNIHISEAQTRHFVALVPTPSPQVSGAETTAIIETAPTPIPTIPATETEEPEPTPEPEAKQMVVVKITDGSESVNIRQQPSIISEKVGKAMEGDTFELVSEEKGWFQIKLADGSTAFISSRYAEIEERSIN